VYSSFRTGTGISYLTLILAKIDFTHFNIRSSQKWERMARHMPIQMMKLEGRLRTVDMIIEVDCLNCPFMAYIAPLI